MNFLPWNSKKLSASLNHGLPGRDEGRRGSLWSALCFKHVNHFCTISSIWLERYGHQTEDVINALVLVIPMCPPWSLFRTFNRDALGMTKPVSYWSKSYMIVKCCLLIQYFFNRQFNFLAWNLAIHSDSRFELVLSLYLSFVLLWSSEAGHMTLGVLQIALVYMLLFPPRSLCPLGSAVKLVLFRAHLLWFGFYLKRWSY